MPTAYLSPSLLQDLTNVSASPGAGNTGYPLVWNNTSGRFELAVLGVAGGGTGTSNGSITGTGALTFAAGGTNQNISLDPSGTGKVIAKSLQVSGNYSGYQLQVVGGGAGHGIYIVPTDYSQIPWAGEIQDAVVLNGRGFNFTVDNLTLPRTSPWAVSLGIGLAANRGTTSDPGNPTPIGNYPLLTVFQGGGANFTGVAFRCRQGIGTAYPWAPLHVGNGPSESGFDSDATSTTTGCAIFSGGVAVGKSVFIGLGLTAQGSKINFANIPTSATGLAVGDLWRDGETVKVKL